MLEGQGTQFYEGGTQAMYSGGWKGGQPHGQGTYYDHDGRLVYEGMYVWCFGKRGGVAKGNQGGSAEIGCVSACSPWARRC